MVYTHRLRHTYTYTYTSLAGHDRIHLSFQHLRGRCVSGSEASLDDIERPYPKTTTKLFNGSQMLLVHTAALGFVQGWLGDTAYIWPAWPNWPALMSGDDWLWANLGPRYSISALVPFPVAVINYSDQSNLMEKEFIFISKFKYHGSIMGTWGWGFKAAGAWSTWTYHWHGEDTASDKCKQFTLSLSYNPGCPDLRTVPPTVMIGFTYHR